jgi:predicted DCC family thiol-disulfide oxidoreductase YuxK
MADAHVVMLYDGLCGFCNKTVQWLLKRDRYDRFRFAPQQSSFASARIYANVYQAPRPLPYRIRCSLFTN